MEDKQKSFRKKIKILDDDASADFFRGFYAMSFEMTTRFDAFTFPLLPPRGGCVCVQIWRKSVLSDGSLFHVKIEAQLG